MSREEAHDIISWNAKTEAIYKLEKLESQAQRANFSS